MLTAFVTIVLSTGSETAHAAMMAIKKSNMTVTPAGGLTMIPISIAQLRDQIRSNHPLLAAIADRIQTMDIKDTLKYTIGVEMVSNLLKAHARQLIENQTATSP
jgi:hypothetical protein